MSDKESTKGQYEPPKLRRCGTVGDLTHTGLTTAGGDAKGGSVLSQGV